LKLFFERLRDRMEVRFSPLFFILIDLCKNVIHEKLSRTPLLALTFGDSGLIHQAHSSFNN